MIVQVERKEVYFNLLFPSASDFQLPRRRLSYVILENYRGQSYD